MLKLIKNLLPLEGRFVAVTEVEGTSTPFVSAVNFWWQDGELLAQTEDGWVDAHEEYHVNEFKHFVISESDE